jgi:cytochrome c oxidase subunit 2
MLFFKKLNNLFETMEFDFKVQADTPEFMQLSFQDPASPIVEGIINLHHDIMTLLIFVLGFVTVVMGTTISAFNARNYTPAVYYTGMTHHAPLEFVWTLIPCLILWVIAMPSFSLIYSLDDLLTAKMTIKVIGHQWYWSYEYGEIADDNTILTDSENQTPKSFDSYMVSEENLTNFRKTDNVSDLRVYRLLEVDNRLIVPWLEHIRFLITSADVLHSWAVPSLGIKMDAVPGRINQVGVFINRSGVFYGQCSEICGVNHAFMPICLETY